jgi:hypothetical protein
MAFPGTSRVLRRFFVLLAAYCWAGALIKAPVLSAAESFWTAGPDVLKPVAVWNGAEAAEAAGWRIVGKGEVVEDEILGRKVTEVAKPRWALETQGLTLPNQYAVEALVRFHDPEPTAVGGLATLRVGMTTRGTTSVPAYSLTVNRRGERSCLISPVVGDNSLNSQPLRPGVSILDNKPTRWQLNVAERFPLETISPVWDEEFRVGIENDMTALPLERNRWRRLRIEVGERRVRMYHDGLLAFDESRDAIVADNVLLEMTAPARVAEVRIEPLAATDSRFEPVVLDDLCNAAGLVAADALPPARTPVTVGDVPLVFPARSAAADHVDVGRSLFRYRLSSDPNAGDPTFCWPMIGQLDPARLRVRAPVGAYRRLWIVAAADDDANSVPLLTARFYKPRKGWAVDAVATVPSITAQTTPEGAKRLPVRRADGSTANLWLLPIELDAAALASEMRNELVLHLELTKEVKGFRHYPDPFFYGYFQAGLPSAVRVFAATLERAPLEFIATGNRPGNIYPYPEQPEWEVKLSNPHGAARSAQVVVDVTSPGGKKQRIERQATLSGDGTITLDVRPAIEEFGLFDVTTTVTVDGHAQARSGTFVTLPPDSRKATAKNSRWGLWYWHGAHDTHPVAAESMQMFKALGSQIAGHADYKDRFPWRLGPTPHLAFRTTPAWAFQDPYDPAEYAKYVEECGQYVLAELKKHPDTQYVSMFAEHSISLRVTHGIPPEAFGKPWYDYTDEEKRSILAHLISAQAACEGVRKYAPGVKFLFGHCGPLFSLPFMKQGYPKDLFDGYGVDAPQFERMPERTPRAVECNAMYFLNQEMKKLGYDKELVHVESYYPPTHPLALSLRESADSVVRTAALSLANGTDRFLACWTLDDPEGAWGSQHYGPVGIVGRRPELNPKPGAAAYATMTQMLDTAKYDGWVPTGSRTAYCVRFKEAPTKSIYCLWTIRGTRPLTVTLPVKPATKGPPRPANEEQVLLTDENGNERRLHAVDGKATIEISSTPVWLTTINTSVAAAEVGAPRYDEAPGKIRQTLDDFERSGAWSISGKPNPRYATNSWDMVRELAPYQAEYRRSEERGSNVVQIRCEAPTSEPDLTARYGVFEPARPIAIPGKARAVGLWANGNSGWGRVVYEIVDAKGEIFQSIGTKDDWNCDDTHSWSNFNFDGWRYMEFPLPANSPGDNYREQDSVWWNHSAEGIVDLPVSLSRMVFEMSTHQIYVDEMVPVENKTIEIDDLTAVFETTADTTDAPIRRQREAADSLRQKGRGEGLPNPIALRQTTGVGPATTIVKFYTPEQFNDGTRIHAAIEPVAGAKEYQVWVSAYPDGSGAVVMSKGAVAEPLVNRLRPGMPLYFFVTYTDANDKPSKPSAMATITLKDEFLQK